MTKNLLNALSIVARRSVENMYLSQMETGIIILEDGVKKIQLEQDGTVIPFSMCDFNEHLQDYTIHYKESGEELIKEATILNHLEVNEKVALSSINNGHRYLVHHKVVSSLYDGL